MLSSRPFEKGLEALKAMVERPRCNEKGGGTPTTALDWEGSPLGREGTPQIGRVPLATGRTLSFWPAICQRLSRHHPPRGPSPRGLLPSKKNNEKGFNAVVTQGL